ncbi:Zinc finger CCHC domain-containing protein 4 [Gryllus bimaculatus]|nr:Zinc finger CCHC domain-containing protein 4 [Gryllus bimaculatus]
MFEVEEQMTNITYVDISPNEVNNHPFCPHGPTLLFSRHTKKGDRKYYACSACRNRKLCNFFHWADEKYSSARKQIWDCERKKFIGDKSHQELYDSLHTLKSLISKNQVIYCHTCNKFLKNCNGGEHADHNVNVNISLHQIMHPTEMLKPLECDKREAQYLFSRASVKALINIALHNNINSVICIGAPRIHEYIKTTQVDIRSILLDLDKRYHMFYGPEDFCWFNSFNFHFFLGHSSEQSFMNFLRNDKRHLLILDPPFGGRLEPLAHTLKNIQALHKKLHPCSKNDLSVILIYPYFLEQHVVRCLPTFNMIDYKITYDNHPLFSQGAKARKLGSPVRIFTNICPEKVILPFDEGYKFCEICAYWVSPENKHCDFCNKCTSKNGSTYVHCKKCQKCVKPTWKHCGKCKRCCLEPHTCASIAPSHHCYHCGEKGHKKEDCKLISQDDKDILVVNISNNSYKRKGGKCEADNKKRKVGKRQLK